MGVRLYKSLNVNGEPIEYIKQSTQQTFAINQLVRLGSTGAGGLEYLTGTTPLGLNSYITMKATTGSSQELVPVMRITEHNKYIIDHCSSETVRSTTDQGLTCAVSSSGGCVIASTGAFHIEIITNTSDTSAQKAIGTFMVSSTY